MDFWGRLGTWWIDAVSRADWIAVIAAFLATLLGSGLAAWIALHLQNKEFKSRADELLRQTGIEAAQRRNDWRRVLGSKAFDLLNDAAMFGTDPYWNKADSATTEARLHQEIDSMQMEFRLDAEPSGNAVGEWYKRSVDAVMSPAQSPAARAEHVKGLTARVRFELTEWIAGRLSNEDFRSK
jgi:hypothetical protein